jgi:hypothetical protein
MLKNFHTVYDSYEEKIGGRDYLGKHSSQNPYDDYLGSYSDDTFDPTHKIVLGYSKTAEGAVWLEIQWQRVLGVVEDPQYANQSYQTSSGFDTTGRKRPPSETSPGGKIAGSLPFWNDGKTEKRSVESPGEGWVEGKLPFSQTHKSRISATVSTLIWWTNGLEETRCIESPGEGWKEGRLELKLNGELWVCLETGHITTPGPLTRYQKSRGIDTSLRRKL